MPSQSSKLAALNLEVWFDVYFDVPENGWDKITRSHGVLRSGGGMRFHLLASQSPPTAKPTGTHREAPERMARSQNATFRGNEPESIGDRIRGESFARRIAAGLSSRGWSIGEIDDWRDAGFLIPLIHQNAHIDIVVSNYNGDDRRWILQIAPARYPGLIRRFFGSAVVATSTQIQNVATDIHTLLVEGGCSDFLWCWDDLPDSDVCDRVPMPDGRQSDLGMPVRHTL